RSSGEVVPAGGRAAAVRDRGGGRAGGGLRADAAGLSPGVEAAERAAAAVRPDQVPVVPPDDRRGSRADPGAPPGIPAPRAGRDDDPSDLGAGGPAGVPAGRMLVDPRGQLGHAAGDRAGGRPGVQDVPGLREGAVSGDRARAGAGESPARAGPRAVDRLFALYMLVSGVALVGATRPAWWPALAAAHALAIAAALRVWPVAP